MKEFLEVFKYTIRENARKKSFIISTVLILIIVVAAMVIPAAITVGKSDGSGNSDSKPQTSSAVKSTIYLADDTGVFEAT